MQLQEITENSGVRSQVQKRSSVLDKAVCNFLSKQQMLWELTLCHVILEEDNSHRPESLRGCFQGSLTIRPPKSFSML